MKDKIIGFIILRGNHNTSSNDMIDVGIPNWKTYKKSAKSLKCIKL